MPAAESNLSPSGDWTVDKLENLPDCRRYELVDGWLVLLDRPPVYQFPLLEVGGALEASCPPDLVPLHRVPLQVDARSQPCPDVVVLKPDHLDRSPVPVDDAVLVFDVIPPDWHYRDLTAKERIYSRAGVADYWLLDRSEPGGFTLMIFRHRAKGGLAMVESTQGVFTTHEPYPATIDLPALTETWTKRWERIHARC